MSTSSKTQKIRTCDIYFFKRVFESLLFTLTLFGCGILTQKTKIEVRYVKKANIINHLPLKFILLLATGKERVGGDGRKGGGNCEATMKRNVS